MPSTATWLPAALVRAAVVHPAAATPARGRHRAPEPGAPVPAREGERPGRRAEPEEQDSLAWLGFSLRRD